MLRLLLAVSLVAMPALARKTASFRVGAQVIRSASVSARVVARRVHVEHRGAAPSMRVEPVDRGAVRVTFLY